MFLLKILCSLWDFGKCLLINQRYIFATFVDTALLNGGLNQIIFRDLFVGFSFMVYLKSTLNPFFIFYFFFKFKYIKNQWQKPKSGSQILFGLTHHSTKQYPQMLQKYFFDWSVDIFPKSHRLHKIFNKNTVKVSCSCICQKDTKNIIVRLDP